MFDGLKNIGNMMDMLKNARQMQDKIKQIQEDLARKTLTADAGAGLVTATVNGQMQLVSLRIDPARFNPANVQVLEDAIVTAVKSAQQRAADVMREEMQKAAADMGLPPGMLP